MHTLGVGRLAVAAVLVVVLTAVNGCGQPHPTASPSSSRDTSNDSAMVLALDQKYWEAERTKDWKWVSEHLAANYYGVGNDFEVDRAAVESDFKKITLISYELQPPRIRFVRPDLAVVSYLGTMQETFDGADISGRYWYSTTWTLIDNKWMLLVEQEVSLDKQPPPSN